MRPSPVPSVSVLPLRGMPMAPVSGYLLWTRDLTFRPCGSFTEAGSVSPSVMAFAEPLGPNCAVRSHLPTGAWACAQSWLPRSSVMDLGPAGE